MGDFIKTRFADGVIAEVIKFNVEVLLPGIMENEQKCYADRLIMEDQDSILLLDRIVSLAQQTINRPFKISE